MDQLISRPEPSIAPICPFFSRCGGCDSQDVPYKEQLRYKEAWLKSIFKGVIDDQTWQPIVGSPDEYPTYFRNKIRFAFVRENGKVSASRHQKGTEEADIPVDACYLQSPAADLLMNSTAAVATEYKWSLYSPETRAGWLKHLLIRQGKQTGEMLVSLVTDEGRVDGLDVWVERLKAEVPQLKSVYHSQSWGAANTHFEDTLLWGEAGIREKVGDLDFWISPHSFFQTNGSMVETLYNLIGQHACLTGKEHVWDLYAGSATIGSYLAKKAAKVTSIESNPSNLADARWNLNENGISNLNLHEGLVEQVVTSAFCKSEGLPNVIIVDPPRAGLHERLRILLPNLRPQKIIYVSCNPVSCLRDTIDLKQAGYTVTRANGIDMFPHSWHCELVLTLEPISPNKPR